MLVLKWEVGNIFSFYGLADWKIEETLQLQKKTNREQDFALFEVEKLLSIGFLDGLDSFFDCHPKFYNNAGDQGAPLLHYWKSRQYVARIAFSSSQFFVTLFAARNEPPRH